MFQVTGLSIWYYIIGLLLVLVLSFMLAFSFYFLGGWVTDKIRKKRMPKDPKILLNPGKPIQLTEKEVNENERQQFTRFREYEKLRRLKEKSGNNRGGSATSGGVIRPVAELPSERPTVPDKITNSGHDKFSIYDGRDEVSGRKDIKGTRFHSPEFL